MIENQTFRDSAVVVDGTQFSNCVFKNTALVYGGGELPKFVDCQFVGVTLQFTEAAASTLKFLSGLRQGGFAPAVDKMLNGIRQNQY